jgi:hypothetical protein
MNTAAVLPLSQSLASVLRRAAADAAAGAPACVWCGSGNVVETTGNDWPPSVVVACADCGTETSFDRRLARAGRA